MSSTPLYRTPTEDNIKKALESVTPAMRRALTVKGMSTYVAWKRGKVTTQTMNRLHRAFLWIKDDRGGYRETKLGFEVSGRL
jgi:hypothetical protein